MGFTMHYDNVKMIWFEDYECDKDRQKKIDDFNSKIIQGEKISIDDILKLDKKDQISIFFAAKTLHGRKKAILNLNDFLKLRENEKSMGLLYKSVFDKEEVSIDDFLKSNPDSEILSIFYSNLMYVSLSKQSLKNIINLDKNSQIIIYKKIIKLYNCDNNLIKNKDKNAAKFDYFDLMIIKLIGFIEVKDMTDKELINFIDKIQIFYPIFLVQTMFH